MQPAYSYIRWSSDPQEDGDSLRRQTTAIDRYLERHRMKPGITGWAQVNGSRGETTTTEQMKRRVSYDLHYIAHWSLLFDIKVLVLTVPAVLGARNAY